MDRRLELALPVSGFPWQPSSLSTEFIISSTSIHPLFTAMASIAGAFGQSDSDSEEDFYGFGDVGASNLPATGILAEITE